MINQITSFGFLGVDNVQHRKHSYVLVSIYSTSEFGMPSRDSFLKIKYYRPNLGYSFDNMY